MNFFPYIRFLVLVLVFGVANVASAASGSEGMNPPSNQENDASLSIQSSIDRICHAGGGELHLKAGIYHLHTGVHVPCAMNITGEGWQEGPQATHIGGTWLSIEEQSQPAISFVDGSKGASIRAIGFDEPLQTLPAHNASFWQPVKFAPVIFIKDVRGYTYIRNIYMHRIYSGIESQNGGRTTIDGLYGQFFQNAVLLDGEMDISRVNQVHSWPYWSDNPLIIAYQQKNLDTIIMGRVDGAFIDNVFAYAARTGMLMKRGNDGGVATGIQVGKFECDSVAHCARIDAVGVTAMVDEMRQFGQEGIASGHPLPASDAIQINGQASLLLGQVEARLIDRSFLTINSPSNCSNIRISGLLSDFSRSSAPVASLVNSRRCDQKGAVNQFFVAMEPAIISAPRQKFVPSSGEGTDLFWPTPDKR
ncbi:hypothetical protein [Gluconobacter morbifer]|uniref:Pectate lyase superfamily protein domain-containing protein n=1 Tax=Gluconobacter morbifer G707 TaxID=1088869 RepID=G6XLU1_9PROT|nr:hypothetical protein [Gluconobacter morbifer]EHH67346.1 hypothetical protein GMO_23400 [Gluconobacter morbifer G707]